MEKQIIEIEKCKATTISLEIPENTTFDEWLKIGEKLKYAYKFTKWAVGDWLNFGERKYGEMFAQAMDDTGLEYHTLQNYKYVSGHVQISSRRDNLSFSHHALVAALPQQDQEELLNKAEELGWTRAEMRACVMGLREENKAPEACNHLWMCKQCGKIK